MVICFLGGYDSLDFNQMYSNGCISPQHFFWKEGLKTIFCRKSAKLMGFLHRLMLHFLIPTIHYNEK